MKNAIYLVSFLLMAIVVTTWYSCEEDPQETCEKDEYCEIEVTVCCTTEEDCLYKYNGKDYPDTDEGRDELAIDMGCSAIIVNQLTGVPEKDMTAVIAKLKDQLNRVKEQIKSGK